MREKMTSPAISMFLNSENPWRTRQFIEKTKNVHLFNLFIHFHVMFDFNMSAAFLSMFKELK